MYNYILGGKVCMHMLLNWHLFSRIYHTCSYCIYIIAMLIQYLWLCIVGLSLAPFASQIMDVLYSMPTLGNLRPLYKDSNMQLLQKKNNCKKVHNFDHFYLLIEMHWHMQIELKANRRKKKSHKFMEVVINLVYQFWLGLGWCGFKSK